MHYGRKFSFKEVTTKYDDVYEAADGYFNFHRDFLILYFFGRNGTPTFEESVLHEGTQSCRSPTNECDCVYKGTPVTNEPRDWSPLYILTIMLYTVL